MTQSTTSDRLIPLYKRTDLLTNLYPTWNSFEVNLPASKRQILDFINYYFIFDCSKSPIGTKINYRLRKDICYASHLFSVKKVLIQKHCPAIIANNAISTYTRKNIFFNQTLNCEDFLYPLLVASCVSSASSFLHSLYRQLAIQIDSMGTNKFFLKLTKVSGLWKLREFYCPQCDNFSPRFFSFLFSFCKNFVKSVH